MGVTGLFPLKWKVLFLNNNLFLRWVGVQYTLRPIEKYHKKECSYENKTQLLY